MKMYFCLVVCFLMAGAVAAKVDPAFVNKHGGFHKPLTSLNHKPCTIPPQCTYDVVEFISSRENGKFKLVYNNLEGAYDANGKRIGFNLAHTNFNGTNTYAKVILDYVKHECYVIEGNVCQKHATESTFPEQYIPDDATLFNTATLGSGGVVLETWGWNAKTDSGSMFRTATVEEKNCYPIGAFLREYDSKTGDQLQFTERRVYNYKPKIDDPDKYFKPPDSCNQTRFSTKPHRHPALKYCTFP